MRQLHGFAWSILVGLFRVPVDPPTLPAASSQAVRSFRPAPGFLGYLKFQFWILVTVIGGIVLAAWILLAVFHFLPALLLLPLFLLAGIIPDLVAWVALHLRYDTTWYAVTDRSLRIRRGIWLIRETTITFENVQNVRVKQGPLQRWFGIANLIVETAGGGSADPHTGELGPHVGLVEGVADPAAISDLIMERVRRSRSSGLGDEGVPDRAEWSAAHVDVLRETRDRVIGGPRRPTVPDTTKPVPIEDHRVEPTLDEETSRGFLARLWRLPDRPPTLPAESEGRVERFRPDRGYRSYLLTTRWLTSVGSALGFFTAGALAWILDPQDLFQLALVSVGGGFVMVVASVGMHVAALVRFRMTWFVLGGRSLRIRRGLWTISEATITYENIQNLRVSQGPLQRLFGISSLEIQTAGGGSTRQTGPENPALKTLWFVAQAAIQFLPGGAGVSTSAGAGGDQEASGATGRMDGLRDPMRVRDAIMAKVRESSAAGLGDEAPRDRPGRRIRAGHVAMLREIRGLILNPKVR